MDVTLLRQRTVRQKTSFGPFRFVEALPWLILATTMRVIAYPGGPLALPAMIIASVSTLLAFILVANRSIELNDGKTSLGKLAFSEQLDLAKAIFVRIVAMMIVMAIVFSSIAGASATELMYGIDGMAFDQFTTIGKLWSAVVATIILLMVVNANQFEGKALLFPAIADFGKRWFWLSAAILFLFTTYVLLGFAQGIVRDAIRVFWQTTAVSQFIKNLIFFVFIFSFAMVRLWVTLLILTFGLKQSYIRG